MMFMSNYDNNPLRPCHSLQRTARFLRAVNTLIGSNLTVCCLGHYGEYQEYSVRTADIPVYHQEYVTAEFDAVFAEKGLTRNDRRKDLQILRHYNQISLSIEQEFIDPFMRVEAVNVGLNYVAAIDIEIRETATSDIVSADSKSRIHQVVPGESMHEDRARPESINTNQPDSDSKWRVRINPGAQNG